MRLRDIFEYSDTIQPFNEEDANIDWIRLSMAELMSIKQFSYEWCTQSFITLSYHKFGFLLLGRDKKLEEYYIGIPDIYDPKQRYILSLDKIERFRFRDENNVSKPGAYGYWIARVH
ncbi:MAG: DUF6128 domain-containing protein [Cellulosilyticaceae bacterium]